ncbi:MAG: squalene/phytoene synthase family protein [Chthoniobacteraceae bacterium]
MSRPPAEAREITRASKSNLALAFVALPPDRREDITIFYAWCRVIDDIGDEPGRTVAERQAALDLWKEALRGPVNAEPSLALAVRGIIARHHLALEHFLEIIAGVEMDLAGASYATWEDLRLYCYRVASAVGLISIAIFGCREPASRDYAISLGLALQVTNILRDVGEDWRNGGRVYLPREDLARFGYTMEDLAAGRCNDSFLALMRFEAARARTFYAEAVAARPPGDRRALVAAEIMRVVYSRLLSRIERDGFQVFHQRYRLSRLEKMAIVAGGLIRAKFL